MKSHNPPALLELPLAKKATTHGTQELQIYARKNRVQMPCFMREENGQALSLKAIAGVTISHTKVHTNMKQPLTRKPTSKSPE
jgi:hypothetical protein